MIVRSIIAAGLAAAVATAAQGADEMVNGQQATVRNAPCAWFKKVRNDTWETDHSVRIDSKKNAVRKLAFQKGIFKMDDGQDPYELLEHRCGAGKK